PIDTFEESSVLSSRTSVDLALLTSAKIYNTKLIIKNNPSNLPTLLSITAPVSKRALATIINLDVTSPSTKNITLKNDDTLSPIEIFSVYLLFIIIAEIARTMHILNKLLPVTLAIHMS